METPLRICTIHVNDIITLREDIPVDQITNIKPYFEGAASSVANVLMNAIWSGPINYTISIASSFGTDGCQGMIAKNQSDASIAIVDFPVNEDYEKVNPVVTLMEEPLIIMQAYNRTHQKQLADIVRQSLESFSISLWMSIVCFVLFMGIFLKIRQEIANEECTCYSYFDSFCFFVQHDTNDYPDVTRRTVTLLISVSSFVIITGYFCNLMATDMVVVDKPNVMNTYDDILARPGVTAVFVKQVSDYEHFRDADKDSKEYKLWKVMTTERSTEDDILIDPQGMERVIPHAFAGAYGLSVAIISRLFHFAARIACCRLKQVLGKFPDLMIYATVEPDSPRYGKGVILRQANIPYLKTAAKRFRRAVEAGYVIIMKKGMDEAGMTFDLGDTKIDWDHFRDCMSPTLVMDKPGFQAAHLANYRSLAVFVVISLLISLAILIIENIYFYWKYGGRRVSRKIITV